MSTTASRKAKGRRLQQLVASRLLEAFPTLGENDVQSRSMGCAGSDIILSPAAKRLIGDIDIECKNQEQFSIWAAMKQATDRTKNSENPPTPVVIFTKNRSPVYVSMTIDDWIDTLIQLDRANNMLERLI